MFVLIWTWRFAKSGAVIGVVTTFIKLLDHDVVLAVEFCSLDGRLLSGNDPEPLEAPPGVDREVTVGAGPLVAGRSSKLTGR